MLGTVLNISFSGKGDLFLSYFSFPEDEEGEEAKKREDEEKGGGGWGKVWQLN